MITNTDQQVAQGETLDQIADRIAYKYLDRTVGSAKLKSDILSALRNERERCAKVADNHEGTHGNMHFGGCGAAIAATIRSQP